MNGFTIKNAMTGISLSSSDGLIENGIITQCNRGILVSSVPASVFKYLTISDNKTGIELLKTSSNIQTSNIFQNETGIKINGFSGEIIDNNIYDNVVNVHSETPVKLDKNYLGTINIDEMKIKNVQISKVYDKKLPDGRVVDAISNPYANLSQEERQKKATEFIIEAGHYFRQRNYGKAVKLFEEALKAQPSPEVYYYFALSYQEMKEDENALKYLKEGVEKFPKDSTLQKSLGLMYYQMGKEEDAKKHFEEVMRLNPEDRQVKFLLERFKK